MRRCLTVITCLLALILPLTLPASSLAGSGHSGTLSGSVRVVPNTFLCVRGIVCNGYHGPVTFCPVIRGVLVTRTPCGSPTAQVVTDASGNYSVILPYGGYIVYLQQGSGWELASALVSAPKQVANFTVTRSGVVSPLFR